MRMFKSKIGVGVSTALLLGSAFANDFVDNARVRSVTPEYQRVNAPRTDCYNYDNRDAYYRDGYSYDRSNERGISGSIIGGVTGALIGSQIGRGNGNRAATAVGAIAGAVVGDRVQNNNRNDGYIAAGNARDCRSVDHWETRTTGYRVRYEYAGHEYTTVLPYDPGRNLQVRVTVEPVANAYSTSNNPYSTSNNQW